jgi:hypothetical protein
VRAQFGKGKSVRVVDLDQVRVTACVRAQIFANKQKNVCVWTWVMWVCACMLHWGELLAEVSLALVTLGHSRSDVLLA